MDRKHDRASDWQSRFVAEIPAAVALFDRQLRYRAASPAWIAAFDLSPASLSGQDQLWRAGRQALQEVQRRVLLGETVDDYQIIEPDPTRRSRTILNARPHREMDGTITGVIVTLRQTDLWDAAEAESPLVDPLTGLADRRQFARRLREVLGDPDPAQRAAAVIAIDINKFRHVNTLHGGAVGDQVLRVTAERLASAIRSRFLDEADIGARGGDMVSRLAGDQFAIICAPPPPAAETEAVAARLLRSVENPIAVGGRSLELTANAGLVLTSSAHRRDDDVLRDLDLALRQAKARGPGKVVAWRPAMTTAATHRALLAEQLRRAFDNGEFVLHYQPVVRLSDSRMVGAEALLRWNHPSDGLVASTAFIPVLEEIGLIVEVGNWVIREAVRQAEAWHLLYGRDVIDWVSVNLSARQFADPGRLLAVLQAIYDGGFSPQRLKLEIAETALIREPATVAAALAELHALGWGLVIDDFGAGHVSLDFLRRHSIDTIKIDRAYIAQIGSAAGEKLLQTLLDIAHLHDAATIAEGIEIAAQRDFLRDSGCSLGQGYIFAEPMDGALLGAYALTHAVAEGRGPARTRLAG